MLLLLLGLKAWSAHTSNFDQQLVIDLGYVRNITRISTQGRPLSNEFVQEYTISYGTNGQDYAEYKDTSGNIKVRIYLHGMVFVWLGYVLTVLTIN